MQQGTNRALCFKKAANIWVRYDNAMIEKCGENWQVEHLDIDHAVVHDIAGLPHGSFAMGDGVIGPRNADSIKSRKRMHLDLQAGSRSSTWTMLHQMESNHEWRAGVERVLQVFAQKIGMDFDALMYPESQENSAWCDGVERVLKAMAEVIPVDVSALLQSRHPVQSTSTSRAPSVARATSRSNAPMSDGIDDDQISA